MNTYHETLNYIRSLGKYSNPPHTDLSKIKYLCNLFDNPQDGCKTIHIAGTNGKGSTAAMLFNILKELGYKTGKFISPYIENFNERISTGKGDISEEDIVYYANKIKKTLDENNVLWGFMPNEFDFVTLMAFLYYRGKGCEIAVIETGLGGRLDPTNVIKSPLASVITQVGLDHMQILGDTVEKIALEKCGIIKEKSPVVLYPLNSENVIDAVKNTACEKNCEFIMPDVKFLKITEENIDFTQFEYKNKTYKTKLPGRHQVYNALTVIETAEHLFAEQGLCSRRVQEIYNAIYAGIEKTFFPARFEILSKEPLVIFDGAHNISGVTALKEAIKNLLPDKKIILICGMMRDKNPGELIKIIAGENFAERFIAVPVENPRAEQPRILCEIAQKYCRICEYRRDLNDLTRVFENIAGDHAAVCFGSLYLAGDIKKLCNYRINI